jgi:hypothetical protein
MYINGKQILFGFYNGKFISKGYFNNNLIYNNDVVTITINPTPNDAKVTFSDYEIGIISNDGKSITVKKDTNVTYTIAKSMYSTLTSQITASENQILDVNLERLEYSLSYPDNSNIVLYNFDGEIVSSSSDIVRLDVTISRNFTLHFTNVNRNISSTNLLKDGVYTCFVQKGTEVRIYSTYQTDGWIKVTRTYNKRFVLNNDTSLTINDGEYSY